MSLILDALNRSRDDARQVPGLATSHHGDAGSPGGGLRTWLLSGALAVAVILIVWLLWERGGPEVATPRASAPAPLQDAAPAIPSAVDQTEPVPDSVPAPATIPATAAAAPTEALARPSRDAPTELPEPGPQAPSRETPADAVADTATDSVSASASASVAALYRQQQLVSEEVPASSAVADATAPAVSRAAEPVAPDSMAREEQPIDIEKIVVMAEQEMENTRLAEHPAPFLSALSQQTKDAIPTLLYQAHDYSSSRTDSFVLINGKTLKQGGATRGVRVDEILPDSVVLSFQGTQFRLRALNSWVNL